VTLNQYVELPESLPLDSQPQSRALFEPYPLVLSTSPFGVDIKLLPAPLDFPESPIIVVTSNLKFGEEVRGLGFIKLLKGF